MVHWISNCYQPLLQERIEPSILVSNELSFSQCIYNGTSYAPFVEELSKESLKLFPYFLLLYGKCKLRKVGKNDKNNFLVYSFSKWVITVFNLIFKVFIHHNETTYMLVFWIFSTFATTLFNCGLKYQKFKSSEILISSWYKELQLNVNLLWLLF